MKRVVPLLLGAAIAAFAVKGKKRRRPKSAPRLPNGVPRAQILFFQAQWCPACQKARPVIKDIAKRYPNVVFTDVDIEEDPQRASAFSISSIPAFVALMDGKEVDRREGFKDASDLEGFVSEAFAESAVGGDESRKAIEA
jgi:thiol-disulfide isomerase/thioredoxin